MLTDCELRRSPDLGKPLRYIANIDGDDEVTKLITPDDRMLFHMGYEGHPAHEIQSRLEWREKHGGE